MNNTNPAAGSPTRKTLRILRVRATCQRTVPGDVDVRVLRLLQDKAEFTRVKVEHRDPCIISAVAPPHSESGILLLVEYQSMPAGKDGIPFRIFRVKDGEPLLIDMGVADYIEPSSHEQDIVLTGSGGFAATWDIVGVAYSETVKLPEPSRQDEKAA